MTTLRTPGKLALILISALVGCGEDGPFDPLSKAADMSASARENREMSLLADIKKTTSCKVDEVTSPTYSLNISRISTGTSNCVITIGPYMIPSNASLIRIRSSMSLVENKSSSTVSADLVSNAIVLASLLFRNKVPNLDDVKSIDDFTISIPDTNVIAGRNSINITLSFQFTNATYLNVSHFSLEFDVPKLPPGSI